MPEQKFKTSFIPNKPVQPVKKGGVLVKNKASNLVLIITIVIFLGTMIVYGGSLYLVSQQNREIESQKEQIKNAQNLFEQGFIDEASRLDQRIKTITLLLENHVAPTQIFELLEAKTLSTIGFDKLTYKHEEDGIISLEATGVARGYESLVQQSDRYGEANNFLRDILFSDFQNQEPLSEEDLSTGKIFKLSGKIDPKLVSYVEALTNNFNLQLGNQDSAPPEEPDNSGDSFEFPENNN